MADRPNWSVITGPCRVCRTREWTFAFRWKSGDVSCLCSECLRWILIGEPETAVMRFRQGDKSTYVVLTGRALADALAVVNERWR